jgi:P22_AR N-terminal domain.
MTNTTTALQVTNFNFYGDELIALKDNATGEVYTSINHVLRNIGFTERQIKHLHKKWNEDVVISKGVQNYVLPSKNGNQETSCISNRKLPIALTKITITPKMKQNQPELTSKLELYQDKCSDILASVFIDHKDIDITPIAKVITSMSQAITVLASNITTMQHDIQELKQSQRNQYLLEKKYPSAYYQRMNPKYKMLMKYFDCTRQELYSSIYKELEDSYGVDIEQIYEEYCYENHLSKEECFRMDAIEHNTMLRDGLTLLIDSSLVKYGLQTEDEIKNFKRKTLFDREPEETKENIKMDE